MNAMQMRIGANPTDASDQARPHVFDLVGGRRGAVDGGLPPLVFVIANAFGGSYTARPAALASAIAAAVTTGPVIVVLRLVRREPLKQALGGLAGLSIAVAFAARSGARGFFLPGILVDAAYGIVFAASAATGRPLVGTIYYLLYGGQGQWRADQRLRRAVWLWYRPPIFHLIWMLSPPSVRGLLTHCAIGVPFTEPATRRAPLRPTLPPAVTGKFTAIGA